MLINVAGARCHKEDENETPEDRFPLFAAFVGLKRAVNSVANSMLTFRWLLFIPFLGEGMKIEAADRIRTRFCDREMGDTYLIFQRGTYHSRAGRSEDDIAF